ncbi:MAG TPA: carboxypeptidase-like regulatory domain-containing protein [Gemmatimonadaceae bacterium]|jgi:hypothetical protein
MRARSRDNRLDPSSVSTRYARNAFVRTVAAIGLLLAVVTRSAPAQARARTDVVTGHVRSENAEPVVGADVVITIAPSAATVRTRSDSSGNFRLVVSNGTGEYVLFVGMIGRVPFRKRLTASGSDTTFSIDARLPMLVQSLTAMNVQARRARPLRALGSDGPAGNDATDKTSDAIAGAISPDLQSNFEARASTVPGIAVTPNGIAVFGLGSDANSTKLNGLDFGGSDLPRDARFEVRFRTSPWNPTSGGYAGVETSITLGPGNNIASRRGHITFDGAAMQAGSPTARQLGQSYNSISLSEGGVGAYALDKAFYNFGVQLTRRTSDGASLADRDATVLNTLGVSPDSAARVVSALGAAGIPNRVGQQPVHRTSTDVSFIERIDRAPAPAPAVGTGPPGAVMAATFYGRYSEVDAASLTPTVTPAFTSHSTGAMGGVQGLHSKFIGTNGDVLTETTSGISLSDTRSAPYASLPTAAVSIVSDTAVGSVNVGGNGYGASDRRIWSWETVNRTAWQLYGKETFPVSVYLQSRFDGFDDSPSANRLGRFSYASAGDFVANQPTSFTRTLNISDRRGGQWVGASAIGGDWIHKTLKVTGGARVDANAFTTAPAPNQEVDDLFGLKTNTTPHTVSVSPRLGFVWRYSPTRGFVSLGTLPNAIYRGQRQLRGGIGKFQGALPSTQLSDAIGQTGAATGVAQLACIGSAVPTPDWRSYSADAASIPATCANGAPNFATNARTVTTYASNFSAPETWRGNLGWTSSDFLNTYVTLDATYSRTAHLGSTLDHNFSGAQRFALGQEANRPVFIESSDIVASSGAMTSADSRRFTQYGRVAERVADLHSDARQLSIYLMPNLPIGRLLATTSYTFLDSRVQSRGLDANTSTRGDPRGIEWSRSPFAQRHTFISQVQASVFRYNLTVSGLLRVASGFAYTPLVSGDVNGDGASNDRAFVFNPSTTTGLAAAPGISQLLSSAPSRARDCLKRQIGAIAGANSCSGPWTATLNGNVSFSQLPGLPDAALNINFANITGGVDQLLHGADHLRGWGTAASPDPVLLQVRGFDQMTKGFVYDVNQRFGTTSSSSAVLRNPFRITIDLQFRLGRTTGEQAVEQRLRIKPSLRGTRASADTIKARYLLIAGLDIYREMLGMADSLALSRAQTELLQQRQGVLRYRADSIYTILADHLAGLPLNFDSKKVAAEVNDTREALWVVIRSERDFIEQTLTSGQIRLLPSGTQRMVLDPSDRSITPGPGWAPLPRKSGATP